MKKVNLRWIEMKRYQIIKKLCDNGITINGENSARIKLGVCKRTIKRYIKGYQTFGKEFFIHKNRNRKPKNAIPTQIKHEIIELFKNRYYDMGTVQFNEFLKYHNLNFSDSTIRNILDQNLITTKHTRRNKKREFKKKLRSIIDKSSGKKLESTIKKYTNIESNSFHPPMPKEFMTGALIQMDASQHFWIKGQKWHLHAAIDETTGNIVGAYFTKEETLDGYYHVLKQMITDYGIPAMIVTDRRTIFEYESKVKKKGGLLDTFTQFQYVANVLGIDIKVTSIPQAKGKIERLFGTLQSRILPEFRLKNIQTIQQANIEIQKYVNRFNLKNIPHNNTITSAWEMYDNISDIDYLLSVRSVRVIKQSTIKFENNYYLLSHDGEIKNYHNGVRVLVMKTLSGKLMIEAHNIIHDANKVQQFIFKSTIWREKEIPTPKIKKTYKPSIDHPFKRVSYENYLQKQKTLNN